MQWCSAADRWAGNRDSLPQAPSVRGAPTSAKLFQGSLFHPSLASLRGPFRHIIDFKSSCFFASRFTLLTQTSKMHTWSYVTTAQPLTRALYVALFNLKKRQLAGMYVLYACSKRSLKSPQNTLEHACKISKIFWGHAPDPPHTQSIEWAPLFAIALGPHNPLGGPAVMFNDCMSSTS